MKICFMGTPNFAVPTLQRLIESPHEIALVVTQPSKPKGRSSDPVDPPVKVLADEHGLKVIQPVSLRKTPIDDQIRELGIDVIVVVAYGKILPDALFEAPRIGSLNVHASLLPEYRGAAPIQRALMDGRLETGVTIMKVVAELDAGPIISQERVEIHEDDDARSISHILSVIGADLLIRALDDIEKEGVIEGEEQDESLVTYAPIITKSEGEVDWTLPAEQIMFRLRGLSPWPGLFTSLAGKRLKIIQAEPLDPEELEPTELPEVDEEDEDVDRRKEAPAPGMVTAIMKGFGPVIQTGGGLLLLTKLQLEGKAAVAGEVFINGTPIKPGQRLGE